MIGSTLPSTLFKAKTITESVNLSNLINTESQNKYQAIEICRPANNSQRLFPNIKISPKEEIPSKMVYPSNPAIQIGYHNEFRTYSSLNQATRVPYTHETLSPDGCCSKSRYCYLQSISDPVKTSTQIYASNPNLIAPNSISVPINNSYTTALSPRESSSPIEFPSSYPRTQSQLSKETPPSSRQRRVQVQVACIPCRKACKKCENKKPCFRCVSRGIESQCIKIERKKREKGTLRGPYKRCRQKPTIDREEYLYSSAQYIPILADPPAPDGIDMILSAAESSIAGTQSQMRYAPRPLKYNNVTMGKINAVSSSGSLDTLSNLCQMINVDPSTPDK